MALNDPLASALTTLLHAEQLGRTTCEVQDSKVIRKVLDTMKASGYVGGYEPVEGVVGRLTITLSGTVNKCGVIKPRYNIGFRDFERFEKRYLPAKNMGIVIVSTSQGIVTHREAKEKHNGGKLIAYCY